MRVPLIAAAVAVALLVSGCTSDTATLEKIRTALVGAESTLEGALARAEAGNFDQARDIILNAKIALDKTAVDVSTLSNAQAKEDYGNYITVTKKLADALTDMVDSAEASKTAMAKAKTAPQEALSALKSSVAKLETAKNRLLEAKPTADRIQDTELKKAAAGLDTVAQFMDRTYVTPIKTDISNIEKAAAEQAAAKAKVLVNENAALASGEYGFYSYQMAKGAQVSVEVKVLAPEREVVDVFTLNSDEYGSYLNEVQGRGGKFRYLRENGFLSTRDISTTFTAPADGTYYLVVDNTELPPGGASAVPTIQGKVKVVAL